MALTFLPPPPLLTPQRCGATAAAGPLPRGSPVGRLPPSTRRPSGTPPCHHCRPRRAVAVPTAAADPPPPPPPGMDDAALRADLAARLSALSRRPGPSRSAPPSSSSPSSSSSSASAAAAASAAAGAPSPGGGVPGDGVFPLSPVAGGDGGGARRVGSTAMAGPGSASAAAARRRRRVSDVAATAAAAEVYAAVVRAVGLAALVAIVGVLSYGAGVDAGVRRAGEGIVVDADGGAAAPEEVVVRSRPAGEARHRGPVVQRGVLGF
ncbi:hypothetical protein I4F81_005575 [Pyropia yezoensis]|uniref:Uncharacterized protein n=1 Tax=Pyropia yezoensis TaxID=2788 RepID=A0ACC3BYJ4_PYRYE|nr:hypothetical protein I4F81_005575 [Neopyropia yezoensis]